MKKLLNWQVMLALILLIFSALFYFIHYLIFKDLHHIFLYLIGDIAFLFIDVLIVMLVLHRILVYREKSLILKKLNMIIGTFFSEAGTELIKKCCQFDLTLTTIKDRLVITNNWSDKNFLKAYKYIKSYKADIHIKNDLLNELKFFLLAKRPFLLNLLGNPNLLEHESFSELLWAVFHLTDELAHRQDLAKLSQPDSQHICGDIARAYQHIILQWLAYIKHLKQDYPYLFSLAIRTNPFDVNACVEIK